MYSALELYLHEILVLQQIVNIIIIIIIIVIAVVKQSAKEALVKPACNVYHVATTVSWCPHTVAKMSSR